MFPHGYCRKRTKALTVSGDRRFLTNPIHVSLFLHKRDMFGCRRQAGFHHSATERDDALTYAGQAKPDASKLRQQAEKRCASLVRSPMKPFRSV
jgi:hypothetical protein